MTDSTEIDSAVSGNTATLSHYTTAMHRDIEKVLIPRGAIARRVEALAIEIMNDIGGTASDGQLLLVPVLTGSLVFVADLVRHLPVKMRIGVVTASSYPGASTTSTGTVEMGPLPPDMTGCDVLIVDDILDSGRTITRIRGEIEASAPNSVRACVMLRKKIPAAMATKCEYVGFDIEDEFAVGYGLDYDGYYRNLPDVCALRVPTS
jgi:hypoxanthine phosphoribosyltransferase